MKGFYPMKVAVGIFHERILKLQEYPLYSGHSFVLKTNRHKELCLIGYNAV
jgi:hypothetical protein